MPVLFKYTEPLLGVWKIEESSEELLSMLEQTSEYLPFLQQIKTEKRRQEWLASRVLLKELAGEELLIAYHDDGAPYLLDSSLSLSISHTNGYAAVLLQEQGAVGIDIEYRSDRVLKIRSRFMSPEENASVGPDYETEHLHVEPFTYTCSGELWAFETRTPERKSYVLSYKVFPEFVLVYSIPSCFGNLE